MDISRFWLLNILESSNTVKLFGNYLILLVLLLRLAMWENGSIYSQTNFVPLLRQSSSEYSAEWINDSEILDSGWWKQEPSLYGPCELYPAILVGVFFPSASGSSLYLKLYLKSAHRMYGSVLNWKLEGDSADLQSPLSVRFCPLWYASLQCLSHLLPQISSSISLIQAWVLPLHMSWKASPGRELEQL